MKEATKKRRVLENLEFSQADCPEDLNNFIDWITEIRDGIPEQFKQDARIDIDPCPDGYGGAELTIEVWYPRPETRSEGDKRRAASKAKADAHKQGELEQLARLKAKYEEKSDG